MATSSAAVIAGIISTVLFAHCLNACLQRPSTMSSSRAGRPVWVMPARGWRPGRRGPGRAARGREQPARRAPRQAPGGEASEPPRRRAPSLRLARVRRIPEQRVDSDGGHPSERAYCTPADPARTNALVAQDRLRVKPHRLVGGRVDHCPSLRLTIRKRRRCTHLPSESWRKAAGSTECTTTSSTPSRATRDGSGASSDSSSGAQLGRLTHRFGRAV